jgi:hypothetical protein
LPVRVNRGRAGVGHADSAELTSRDVTTRVTASRTTVVLLAAAIAIAATLTMIAPRFAHTFPSMVDDWAAIDVSLDQLPDALTGRNPEELRYRPGWVVWNAVQWHTLGAPTQRWGPQVWGMLRLAVLALGLSALAATVVHWRPSRRGRLTAAAMVAGVPLVVMTIPAFAIDLARWGPQEPLLVGAMSLGAALIVWSLRAAASGSRRLTQLLSLAVGVALWWIGALQKEISLAVVVLVPFLWPYVRRDGPEWRQFIRERRVLVTAAGVGVIAPLLLVAWYTVALARGETRVYGAQVSPEGMLDRIAAQLSDIDGTLGTPLAWLIIASFFLSLFWAIDRDVDWLALGLLACALASTAWAAQTGVVQSRYYLPATSLVVLALVRTASARPRLVLVPVVAATLLADRLNGGHEGAVDWLIREAAHDPMKGGAIVALSGVALGIALVAKVDRRAVLAVAASALLLATVAQTTNAVVSRFYPVAALIALLGLRRRSPERWFSAHLVAALLIVVSLVNVVSGGDAVDTWLDREQAQEALVRAVATRQVGGCTVTAVGVEAEFVRALPVMRRFVSEPASGCVKGERFVAVVDGDRSSVRTPLTHPELAACAPWEVVWRSQLARILRCGVTA